MDEIKNLDEIINKLNDQLGVMGNNLIEKQFELDYLNEVNQKLNAVNEQLYKINKRLVDQLNKNQCFKKMNY
jgi:hypothetical protein